MSLTKKRRLVLSHYVSDPSATLEDALIKTGYSPKRAKISACELRRDPEFVAAIERKQNQKLEKLERGELTPEEIINGIRDIDDECKAAGTVASFLQLRLKAAEMLCKIKGMFIEKVEFGFGAELAEAMKEARQRLRNSELPALPAVIEATVIEDREPN
jgi:hypothetical protein